MKLKTLSVRFYRTKNGRIAGVLLFFADGEIILAHGFIKKAQKTPEPNLRLARDRKRDYPA